LNVCLKDYIVSAIQLRLFTTRKTMWKQKIPKNLPKEMTAIVIEIL